MSTLRFQHKTAVITGAGQGIGLEIAARLTAEGASVILNDKDETLAHKAAQQLKHNPGKCLPVPGDASDIGVIHHIVDTAVSRFGTLDMAIANAGITLFGDFMTYSPGDFHTVMNVNLAGSFFLAQAAARQMIKQRMGGRIVFMSSVTGHQAHKNLAAYGMSKAALEMLAKTLVVELAPFGITTNAVAPGATTTERTTQDPEYITTWSSITPLGKPATPQDIAAATLFLLSAEAAHITGQTIVIDGGWTSTSPSPYTE
jgi:3-oxoacyl-[acyl-carrier protein] reductase